MSTTATVLVTTTSVQNFSPSPNLSPTQVNRSHSTSLEVEKVAITILIESNAPSRAMTPLAAPRASSAPFENPKSPPHFSLGSRATYSPSPSRAVSVSPQHEGKEMSPLTHQQKQSQLTSPQDKSSKSS